MAKSRRGGASPRQKIGDTQSPGRWKSEQAMKSREGEAALRKSGGMELKRAKQFEREEEQAEMASYKLRNKRF